MSDPSRDEDLELAPLASALAGRYRIVRRLGRGGSAVVYLAEDVKHGSTVALKVLDPQVAALLGPERFLREITTAARLRHPHLLPLFDSGVARDPSQPGGLSYFYYVMPFVAGESLRDRLAREGRLPLREAMALTREIAAGLSYAHEHKIVHRDIKPENILLDSGLAVVADFGIAKTVSTVAEPRVTSEGTAVGTVAYMSPEQAFGDDVDARTDLYSLACVVFEMLDGETPYRADTPQALIAQRLTTPVRSLQNRPDVPPGVEAALRRALAQERESRYSSVAEFVDALTTAAQPVLGTPVSPWRRRWTWVAGAAAILALGGAWRVRTVQLHERLVDGQIPAILAAIQRGDIAEAYGMGVRAEELSPGHPLLQELWPRMAAWLTVESSPPGARVFLKPYADTTASPWTPVGETPIRSLRLAIGLYRLKFIKAGYDTLEILSATPEVARELFTPGPDSMFIHPDSVVHASLVASAEAGGMVRVDVESLVVSRGYVADLFRIPAAPYWIDRTETTNADWQRFVDAGGYQDSTLWDHPLLIDGAPRTWSAAMHQFHDRTGRPGPAGWEGGTYPPGQAAYPVGGISWYEASAYARYAHKELPTIYHWFQAAGWKEWGIMTSYSNIESSGPGPVARARGVNRYGGFDFIGNVKEWTSTATDGSGVRRYVAGGSWLNPAYFTLAEGRAPWDRSADNGVRLMRGPGASAQAYAPTDLWANLGEFGPQNYQTATSDEFKLYRDQLYTDVPGRLNDSLVETNDESRLWRRETVRFTTAYGERMAAYLFIPKGRGLAPPYQAVVYVPSGMAWDRRDSRMIGRATGQHDYFWEFVAMSGRAVLYPILRGTYERHLVTAQNPTTDQTLVVNDVQDVRRALDYLRSRGDIDTARIAYYGVSQGAFLGPIAAAVEPRFRTAILLLSVCFNDPRFARLPPATPMRFLPYIHMPVLSIAGAQDYVFSDGPACLKHEFSLLGTPARDRKNLLYPGSHGMWGTFGYQARAEILDWLDRYLGPVEARTHGRKPS